MVKLLKDPENQEERCFSMRHQFPILVSHLGKLASSNCCIFEMKHSSGLETYTKIYFLFIFNLG